MSEGTQIQLPILSSVDQLCERHQAFKRGQVRWLLFKAEENGLAESGAIVRLGRRVLIDEQKFFAWLLSLQAAHRQGPAAAGRREARAA